MSPLSPSRTQKTMAIIYPPPPPTVCVCVCVCVGSVGQRILYLDACRACFGPFLHRRCNANGQSCTFACRTISACMGVDSTVDRHMFLIDQLKPKARRRISFKASMPCMREHDARLKSGLVSSSRHACTRTRAIQARCHAFLRLRRRAAIMQSYVVCAAG